ncbi:hypothetical protein KC340_g268 [Hortaea werneckii]|nr:hypothetical protein KC342_g755 [Hortaea werneckii]KAI7108996.1 hypothetical protein KC339_g1091 [Hortaea werneckii]KAI7230133.1 hypothetical protein KC365_g7747 [Hortaea werneckii]KAI7340523.1 hypothetical protein KC340_g268 [Hortaea werneckii]KAI7397898.1 hypothetical protein KC328_g4698 [Hortaea werneckii]
MGRASTTERPSLERLKGLNSLSTLPAQLDEARQLCTHRARADMIAKWLLEKLKSSDEARIDPASWRLLTDASRLLAPERLATLFGQHDLLSVVQKALTHPELDFETTAAIKNLFDVTFDLSEGPRGAALKAFLSVDAARAVTFTGAWLISLTDTINRQPEYVSSFVNLGLLSPAVKVWELRKHLADENELFATNCLVPITHLLCLLPQPDVHTSAKRKRGNTDDRSSNISLKSMLAKHIILPARATFSRVENTSSRTGELQNRLQKLKDFNAEITNLTHDDRTKRLATVPTFLEIALQCTPSATPRQRLKEKVWVEGIFAALLECLPSNTPARSRVLIDMLDIIQKHASLSKETLTQLNDQYSGLSELGEESGSHLTVNWDLLAKIADLDANVYAELDRAGNVFEVLSFANFELMEGQQAPKVRQEEDIYTLWKARIIVPVMHAFAQNRDITSFVEIWRNEVQVEFEGITGFVWLEIDEEFAQLVQPFMTDEQVTDTVSFHCNQIKEAVNSGHVSCNLQQVRSSAVMLCAVFMGLRDDALIDRMCPIVSDVFSDLIRIFEDQRARESSAYFAHFWKLLRVSLEIWFPFWAEQQDDKSIIDDRLKAIAQSGAGLKANSLVQDSGLTGGTVSAEATRFIALLLGLTHAYGLSGLSISDETWKVNLENPALITNLDKTSRKAGLSTIVDGNEKAGLDVKLNAIVNGILEAGGTAFDETVHLIVKKLEGKGSVGALNALETLSPSTLSSSQRERILDGLCASEELRKHSPGRQLAAIVRMLELPCPNAGLFKDMSILWNLAATLKSHDEADGPRLLKLLECFTSLVVKHSAKRVSREGESPALTDLSKRIDHHIKKTAGKDQFAHNAGIVTIISTVLTNVRTSPDETAKEAVKPSRLQVYAQALLREVAQLRSSGASKGGMQTLLDAMIALPESVVQEAAREEQPAFQSLDAALEHIAEGNTSDETAIDSKYVQLACTLKTSQDERSLMAMAANVLESELQPKDHVAVLDALHRRYKNKSDCRLRALQNLMTDKRDVRAAELVVFRTLLPSIKEEDLLERGHSHQSVLYTSLGLADNSSIAICRRALDCVSCILKEKSFMTNQSTIERTMTTIQALLMKHHDGMIFMDCCRTFNILLQQYRSRSKDRMNLVVAVMQQLVTSLFECNLGSRYATALSRMLELLCNPPQLRSKRHQKTTISLVDEARKAQGHVGQYVQYILHHYCSQVLRSPLAEGARESLMPGLWMTIAAVEVNDTDGMKVLSAAMNNSERAVLRSVYDDYKAFGKWQGG